jgi:glutathione synthase/RimK-type ligase-like ATP-grasp enzyme
VHQVVGLVTYHGAPHLTDDDRPLVRELTDLGIEAQAVRWDDDTVRWPTFDALVIRSCWDYHRRVGHFLEWLDELERADVCLWNPPSVIRWNIHKSYLVDLGARGVAIPETILLKRGDDAALQSILRWTMWESAIVKPAISASAMDTWRVGSSVGEEQEQKFRELTARADVLVQQYVPEITSAGEWSVIFVGGQYSHAILKRPRSGDYRVQEHAGGVAASADPPTTVIRAAQSVTEHIPGEWLFARVDGITTSRGFELIELECIEPSLFFEHCPSSRTLMAHQLSSRLKQRQELRSQ